MPKIQYDVIIIGAGLGGLTAGAKLSINGKKVLVIEQHSIPGGCATVFKRNDTHLDAGLHEIDGLDPKDAKFKLFMELGVFEHVKFIKLPETIGYVAGDFSIDLARNPADAISKLSEIFPMEKKGLVKFHKRIVAIHRDIHLFCLLPRWKQQLALKFMPFVYPSIAFNMNRSLGSFLDKCFSNEQLKGALIANLAYYHDDPQDTSLLYFAIGNGGYMKAAHYVQGGSQNLSNYLASIITDNGGTIIYNQIVNQIITSGKRAIGVRFSPKFASWPEYTNEYAQTIICNTAIPNVAHDLLPRDLGDKLAKQTDKLQLSNSMLTVFLIFDVEPRELGHKHYSTFVEKNVVKDINNLKELFHRDFTERPYIFCDYGQIDSKLTPKGKSTAVICCCDYLSDWENLSIDEYRTKKRQVAAILIDRLEKLIPGISAHILFYEVATPKTIQRYILTPKGAIYGFAQTVQQAVPRRINVKSSVKNLYYASAWTFPGGGFTGAILSGDMCAKEILNN